MRGLSLSWTQCLLLAKLSSLAVLSPSASALESQIPRETEHSSLRKPEFMRSTHSEASTAASYPNYDHSSPFSEIDVTASNSKANKRRRRIQRAVTKQKDAAATRAMNHIFAQVQERDLSIHPPVPYDEETHPFAYYEKHGRQLQTTPANSNRGFSPLRITFDTSSLDSMYNLASTSPEDRIRIDAVRSHILPLIRQNLSNALSVAPVYGNLPVVPGACYGAVDVKPNYIDVGVENTDLIVFVEAKTSMFGEQLCCATCTTLAAAATCETDQYDRPVSGFVNFCLDRIPVLRDANTVHPDDISDAVSVAEHELTHVLGFHGLMYRFYRHPKTGEPLTPRPFCTSIVTCNDGVTYSNVVMPSNNTLRMVQSANGDDHAFEITLPTVTQVAKNQYDCPLVTGARLENQPTNSGDCFGSHFEERVNYDEAMSAFVQPEGMSYSALTLGLLEDTGWYKANFALAEIAPWGHLAGCEFWDINADCIVGGTVPDYSKGFFCNSLSEANLQTQEVSGTYQCYPDHTHMAICDLFDMQALGVLSPPADRAYFPNPTWGTFFQQADFCPIAYHNPINCEESIRGQSFEKGSVQLPGEVYETGSRCFETTSRFNGDAPACLKMQCIPSKQQMEVSINGATVICDTDFEEHDYPGVANTKLICPRLSVICPDMFCPSNCSGKGVCQYNKALAIASCQCFDSTDTTEACLNSPSPPPLNEGVAICDAVITPTVIAGDSNSGSGSGYGKDPGSGYGSGPTSGLSSTGSFTRPQRGSETGVVAVVLGMIAISFWVL